jgi:hypothetical protein
MDFAKASGVIISLRSRKREYTKVLLVFCRNFRRTGWSMESSRDQRLGEGGKRSAEALVLLAMAFTAIGTVKWTLPLPLGSSLQPHV